MSDLSNQAQKLLGRFYKTVDRMKSAYSKNDKMMSVWADDLYAVEAVMSFLETIRDAPAGDDAADAVRYRHLKEHHSYHYPEGYNPPTPREFGIQWDWQDITPERPGMDELIDREIEAKRIEALEDGEVR